MGGAKSNGTYSWTPVSYTHLIGVTIGDSCFVRIYTGGPLLKDSAGNKRFAKRSDLNLILEKKVTGVTWAIINNNVVIRRGSEGKVFWYWADCKTAYNIEFFAMASQNIFSTRE